MALSSTELKSLRARAHALKPVILVGAKGLGPAVLAETDRALAVHELIKIRLHQGNRDSRARAASQVCRELGAELVQSIGNVLVLYREAPPEA